MKILVINGSPRDEQSNTMVLTRAFLEGAGWTDAEIVSVSKLNIKNCIGCFGCWKATPGECVIKDDMSDVIPKLIEADVIIWSFPLYYYSVPGGLKTLIDRQLPMVLPDMVEGSETGDHPARYDFSHQRHIVISTCGFWTHKGNYDSVIAMYKRLEVNDLILVGQGELFPVLKLTEVPAEMPMEKAELEGLQQLLNGYLDVVRRAGTEYAAGAINSATKTELEKPILSQEMYERGASES